MKTPKDFTPEIQAKIPEYIERALSGVFDGGRYRSFNWDDAHSAVCLQYEKCGYKKPMMIVAENPYEAQLLYHFIKCVLPTKELDSQFYSRLRSQLDSQLDSRLRSQLRSQLDSQFEYTANGVRYSAPDGLHDDTVCSLALAYSSLKSATFVGVHVSGF